MNLANWWADADSSLPFRPPAAKRCEGFSMVGIETIERKVDAATSLLIGLSRAMQRSGRARVSDEQRGAELVREASICVCRAIGNERQAQVLERATTTPALTTQVGWAAELAQSAIAPFILSLAKRSALATVLAKSPQVSLIGQGGKIIPVAGTATPARIVPQGAAIGVDAGAFSGLTLSPFKLGSIMAISEEIAASSNIEAAVRVLLEQSIAAGLDLAAFSASPPGVLAGLVAIAASTSPDPLTAMLADLASLLKALTAPSTDVVFVLAPAQFLVASVLAGSLGYQVAASSALPNGTVIAIDPQGVAAAFGEAKISMADSATVHMDSLALPIATGPQGSAVLATPTRSLYQTDVLGLRVTALTAWAARAGSISFLEGVKW